MERTPFHKSCNKTSRRWFEDYDLLPSEVKKLLQESPKCPDFDDLKEAWKLAEELLREKGFKLEDLLRLNCFEEEAKEARKEALARKKREAKEIEKQRRYQARVSRYLPKTGVVLVRRAKDQRLVNLVTEEEAARLLTTRKEHKDFTAKDAAVKYDAYFVPTKEAEEAPAKKEPPKQIRTSLGKAWGNA